MPQLSEKELLINENEVIEFLGISKRTLQIWRSLKKGPRFIRLGNKTIRYRLSDLQNWIEKNEQGGSDV